ncbi:hypothetical protein OQA88_10003 [Cercophora sp. LCS_1]
MLSDSPVECGQSPPPERSTGKQMHDPPGSGHGLDDASGLADHNKRVLESLPSNPKGPLEDAVKEKFAKIPQMPESSSS